MKTISILALFCLISLVLSAQESNKFYIETGFLTKISVGKPTRNTINYKPGVNANVPEISKFRNPVFGVGFNVNYNFNDHFSSGVGVNINIEKFENHPVIAYEYYDKVLIPLYLRIRYQNEIKTNWFLLSDLYFGYQFSDFKYWNTVNGFYFQESGGLLLGFDIGFGGKLGRYKPIFKIGYELNQFSHEDSLGWIGAPDLSYFDKVYYKTYYHLAKISLSLKI